MHRQSETRAGNHQRHKHTHTHFRFLECCMALLLQRNAIVGHAEAIRTQSRKPLKAHTYKKCQPTNAGQPHSTRRKEATPQLGAAHAASEDTTYACPTTASLCNTTWPALSGAATSGTPPILPCHLLNAARGNPKCFSNQAAPRQGHSASRNDC